MKDHNTSFEHMQLLHYGKPPHVIQLLYISDNMVLLKLQFDYQRWIETHYMTSLV